MSDNYDIPTSGGNKTVRTSELAGGHAINTFTGPLRRTPVGPPEKLSVTTGAVKTLTPPGSATHALLWVENNTIRYYEDGSTPTTGASGNGPPVAAGNVIELDLASFSNFKMIALSATATVHVLYWFYA
jgi:hypothetical protein